MMGKRLRSNGCLKLWNRKVSIFEGCPIAAAGFFCYLLDTLREEEARRASASGT
jgi:hypothetical protein